MNTPLLLGQRYGGHVEIFQCVSKTILGNHESTMSPQHSIHSWLKPLLSTGLLVLVILSNGAIFNGGVQAKNKGITFHHGLSDLLVAELLWSQIGIHLIFCELVEDVLSIWRLILNNSLIMPSEGQL